MKFLIVFISLFFTILSVDLDVIRIAYREAAHDKTKVMALNKQLSAITKANNAALIAYKGAAIALKAKYEKSIKEKKRLFIEGVTYIELAIDKSPNAIEPRFIRIGIQENTPKLLKYKSNIKEDKLFILKEYKTTKPEILKNHIGEYILQSKAFSEEEKAVILIP
ncbi:hypothetical protein [Aquimarina muelleri]|uniref:Uncharacterized protein n=1 Tax=Aquimarina muelleri TaxID=279356 RepID=A0A918JWG3_9FLAO|nr:hypothetical protein [Aquimarina muelleri]MCX2762012.1 hypothetical protein [Aquimarina muelleri]GGX25022.1 hypothetical protein GCM10007384_27620 [Aquimarina muelleri]